MATLHTGTRIQIYLWHKYIWIRVPVHYMRRWFLKMTATHANWKSCIGHISNIETGRWQINGFDTRITGNFFGHWSSDQDMKQATIDFNILLKYIYYAKLYFTIKLAYIRYNEFPFPSRSSASHHPTFLCSTVIIPLICVTSGPSQSRGAAARRRVDFSASDFRQNIITGII